jgi:hypothetical protein
VDASPLLALRLAGQDHALEAGRDYLLGSGLSCDLRLPAAAATRHARLEVRAGGVEIVDLGSAHGTFHNGERIARATLAAGDVLRFGEVAEAFVVRDDGGAAIVPIPALRSAAQGRRVVEALDAAASLRQSREQSFDQLVAAELRRAPWLAASLLVHLVLLLVLWLLLPASKVGTTLPAAVAIDWRERAAGNDAPPVVPDVAVETPEPAFEPAAAAAAPTENDAAVPPTDGAPVRDVAMPTNGARARLVARTGDGEVAAGDLGGAGSSGFRRTVGELRQSGLEIVFVFDSTGSMTQTIHDTKSTITQMLSVLRALVPDARVGLVTYRDRGPNERYLVQSVPLGADFWRAANFVQFVTAEGGGDLPEDVRAGLREAIGQSWRHGARRVVVLAGDAPPHPADHARLLSEVRAFARNGSSFVHTLLTSRESYGDPGGAAFDAFQEIAAAGKGTCQRMAARDRVLQRVLTLAFGREFDQDIAAVIRAVEADAQRVDVRALDLVRRGGPELEQALRQNPLPQPLWNALVRRPRRATAEQLVGLLTTSTTPPHGRQAIAAALQAMLGLPLPPIDPVAGEVGPGEVAQLRARVARLPE